LEETLASDGRHARSDDHHKNNALFAAAFPGEEGRGETVYPSQHATRDDERILICAPGGRNGQLIKDTLHRAGFLTDVCEDFGTLCRALTERPAGALILCEEALDRQRLKQLVETLNVQPPWSEIPLLVLTRPGKTTRGSLLVAEALSPRGNATLIERPLRVLTLLSAVRSALRARRRQYEVRELLEREQAARAQAEAANKAKDQFLAALSHELRTPLNPVLMTVTALQHDPSLPESVREDLDVIRRNVELESSLIDDLLDLTRITRGKLELHQEAVDLHAILSHAVKTCCGVDTERKRLTVRLETSAERHYVWGDTARLSQIFWNLVKNAIKFTPAGGSITVRTANEPSPSRISDDGATPPAVRVEVADTGIGIEPDAASRIFDAFEQENRGITRRFGGLGLGLAICKALVQMHHGTIAVRSQGKGLGSTFTVRLSTVALPTTPSLRSPNEDHVSRARARGGGDLRILLVEDHEATAGVMARLLAAMGYAATVAPNIEVAKRLAETIPFDLLLSDIGLPDGTGHDLLRHIRLRRGDLPAIAVSGYGMEEDVRQSSEAGFAEHLVKPVDLAKLRGAIGRVLSGAGGQSASASPPPA
jgi:signal transduction histidine kinase/ActR/RegA family two-component response regulator